MSDTYAVIQDGVIVNVVLWDGQNDWSPPEGCTAVDITGASPQPGIGWTTSDGGGTFEPPAPTETEGETL